MNFPDFYSLNQSDQFQVVSQKGVLIGDRVQADKKFVLYRVDSFFVELIYRIPENILTGLRSFLTVNKAEPT